MINQNFLIILSGLPASGKSLFASKIKVILEKKYANFKIKIVDPDEIRHKVSPMGFNYRKEHIVRKKSLKNVKLGLKNGFIVINDDLNYFSSMRHELKKIAENLNKKYFLIHVSTPIEKCIEWNNVRGNPIPNQLIYNIKEKFDDFGGYSWDIPAKIYDMSQNSKVETIANDLINYIEINLNVDEFEDQVLKNKKKLNIKYHQNLDRETRKVVGKLLRNSNYITLKKEILVERKLFITTYLTKKLKKSEISKKFIAFLERELKIDIS
ncbi:MAG: adenylyl-sulfate kinase [Promethearchaeota archaeon]